MGAGHATIVAIAFGACVWYARQGSSKVKVNLDRRQGRHLEWTELQECAQSAFNIWVDQPELNWAQEAWEHLTRQGLAAYASELEKCRVKIRFLALAGIYHDWCSIAWQESDNPAYSDWADLLNIREFRLGQLVGSGDTAIDGEAEEDRLLGMGLKKMISAHRAGVLTGLLRAYGDISGLFVSLWNSNKVDRPPDLEDVEDVEGDECAGRCKESAYEILNLEIVQKGPAYVWLDQGAAELLDSW